MKLTTPTANALVRRRLLPPKALPALLTLLVVSASGCAGDIEKRQAVELRKIASQVPVYPGFRKLGEKVVLKHGMVSFFNFYQSNDEFSEIRKFYDQFLTKNGWVLEERDEYRRGDYVIAVLKLERSEGKFDIVFIWRPR